MSLKYSCIKNKFTKRLIYIELLKTPPTEKKYYFYTKRGIKMYYQFKNKRPQRFLKTNLVTELYKKLII